MSDGEEGRAAALAQARRDAKTGAAAQQADVLYREAGQHNPHAARAAKKRAKRVKALAGGPLAAAAVEAMAGVGLGGAGGGRGAARGAAGVDEEYDFEEAFGGAGPEQMRDGEAGDDAAGESE